MATDAGLTGSWNDWVELEIAQENSACVAPFDNAM